MDEFESVKEIPTRVNLKEHYPQSLRMILAASFYYLLVFIMVLISYLFKNGGNVALDNSKISNGIDQVFLILLIGTFTICVIKIAYEYLYYLMFSYSIELEHLTVTKGVFFRSRFSSPIAKITDISLRRNPIEMIFALYSLVPHTTSQIITDGGIEGLAKKEAVDLQAYILTMLETTLPDVKEKVAAKVLETHPSPDIADQMIHAK